MTREGLNKHWEVINAWREGAEVEYYREYEEKWVAINEPSWLEDYKYRVKPAAPEYIPFDFTDAEFLIGKVVKHKELKEVDLILRVTVHSISFDITNSSFEDFLNNYTFLDGSPCGKLKQ